jgi:hypothetical protein
MFATCGNELGKLANNSPGPYEHVGCVLLIAQIFVVRNDCETGRIGLHVGLHEIWQPPRFPGKFALHVGLHCKGGVCMHACMQSNPALPRPGKLLWFALQRGMSACNACKPMLRLAWADNIQQFCEEKRLLSYG